MPCQGRHNHQVGTIGDPAWIAPPGNNCRTKDMLTNNVDYHNLGADYFTRRNLDVS